MSASSHSFLFLCFLFIIIISTTTDTTATTTTLDVTAAVKKTIDILNPVSLQQQKEEQLVKHSSSDSDSFSFSLHPRSSIHHHKHHDYESLTLARLARDTHRVTSLTTKLNFVLSGTNKSEMKPVSETDSVFKTSDFSTPITSGISQGSGEYFAKIGVGTPPQSYYMVVDTGSDVNWLQCTPCTDCYQQTDPIYNPSSSSTYNALPCSSQQCSSLEITACRSNVCLYQVTICLFTYLFLRFSLKF